MVATCTIWTPLNPGPWGWFLPSLVKIQPCISSRSRWTVTLYIGPPPQPVTPHGAIGATLGSATNNLYSSPKKVSTLYTTWLFYLNWIWRRKFEICKVLALGGLPPGPPWWQHDDHLWIPSPYGWFLPCLVKIQPCIFKKKMKQLLFTKGPQGPIGATLGTAMNNFYSSPNKVSTHYITSPFSF